MSTYVVGSSCGHYPDLRGVPLASHRSKHRDLHPPAAEDAAGIYTSLAKRQAMLRDLPLRRRGSLRGPGTASARRPR